MCLEQSEEEEPDEGRTCKSEAERPSFPCYITTFFFPAVIQHKGTQVDSGECAFTEHTISSSKIAIREPRRQTSCSSLLHNMQTRGLKANEGCTREQCLRKSEKRRLEGDRETGLYNKHVCGDEF